VCRKNPNSKVIWELVGSSSSFFWMKRFISLSE
jgi:hypothetical protein